MESKSQTSYINSRPIIFKVQLFWKGHKNLKKSPTCFDAKLLSKNSCFAKTGGLFFQIVWPSHKVLTLHVSRKNINIVANPFTKILFDFKLHNYGYSWIKTYILISVRSWNFKDGGSLKAIFLAKNQHATKERSLKNSHE